MAIKTTASKVRDFCEAAKHGQRCIDDLCHAGDMTLCGFEPDLYEEIWGEDWEEGEEDD